MDIYQVAQNIVQTKDTAAENNSFVFAVHGCMMFCVFAGVILGTFILKGVVLGSPELDTPKLDLATGNVILIREHWGLTFMWLVSHFSIQVNSSLPCKSIGKH